MINKHFILRELITRISTAVDAESVLRTAAEEIGRALGLEGVIVLDGAGTNQTVKSINGHNND